MYIPDNILMVQLREELYFSCNLVHYLNIRLLLYPLDGIESSIQIMANLKSEHIVYLYSHKGDISLLGSSFLTVIVAT